MLAALKLYKFSFSPTFYLKVQRITQKYGSSQGSYAFRSFGYSSNHSFVYFNLMRKDPMWWWQSSKSRQVAKYSAFHIVRPINLFKYFVVSFTTFVGYLFYELNKLPDWISSKVNKMRDKLKEMMDRYTDISNETFLTILKWIPTKKQKPPRLEDDSLGLVSMSESQDFNTPIHKSTKNTESSIQPDFHFLIKRMIEIKHLLKNNGYQDELKLPSIVVIGSQSSGKSSVLESIVGHEFLPKGLNMVTRRPLELTLIHSPNTKVDYAVFSGSKSGPITDFHLVQKMLTEMNLAVPETECVSDSPIDLTIYSSQVPDLTLIDLPGYIQITNRHQPNTLREKIYQLCDKYIQEPNIILAISAADVDLANSEALKASRLVDPFGKRTIGVITKLDLIEPTVGASLLSNKDYPLQLGYIGVICKKTADIMNKGGLISSLTGYLNEREYFQKYGSYYSGNVGIPSLRRTLMMALESVMYNNLDIIQGNVLNELNELEYTFKVQYNDQWISVESYLSYLMGRLKNHFKDLGKDFSRAEVRFKVQSLLEKKLLDIYEKFYWSDSDHDLQVYGKDKDSFLLPFVASDKLERAVAALSKSNLGRLSSGVLSEDILGSIKDLGQHDPFQHHPQTMQSIFGSSETLLKNKQSVVVNQIENALKPFKFGAEFTPNEWILAREGSFRLISSQLRSAKDSLNGLNKEVGNKRLKQIMTALLEQGNNKQTNNVDEIALKNPYLVQKGLEAIRLSNKVKCLSARLEALQKHIFCHEPYSLHQYSIKNTGIFDVMCSWLLPWNYWPFATPRPVLPPAPFNGGYRVIHANYELDVNAKDLDPRSSLIIWQDPCQYACPEIYLYLVMNRLTGIIVTYLHYELVRNFLIPFPEMINSSLTVAHMGHGGSNGASFEDGQLELGRDRLARLVRENPAIDSQLKLQERKQALQAIYEKLSLLKLTKTVPSDS